MSIKGKYQRERFEKTFVFVSFKVASRKDLNSTEKLIYSYISSYWKNGQAFTMSNSTLADYFGMSTRNIQKTIQSLHEKKLIGLDYPRAENVISFGKEQRLIYNPRTTAYINGQLLPRETSLGVDPIQLLNKVLNKK